MASPCLWVTALTGMTVFASSCRGGGTHAPDAPEVPDAPDAPPAVCSGPKGDHVLHDVAFSRVLAGNSTQLFYEGCGPSAGPGSGVCVVTKSTGEQQTVTNGRWGGTSPLAADDVNLWFVPGGFLGRLALTGGAYESFQQQFRANTIARGQLGTSAPVTYFSWTQGLLVASTPTATPAVIAGAPGGDLVVMGGSIAHVLELGGQVHRFDVAAGTDLGTVNVGPVTSAAWSAGSLYITLARVDPTPGAMVRLADGTSDVTKLFDIPSPDLVVADDDSLYYIDQGAPATSAGASVRRAGKTSGAASSVIADGFVKVSGLLIDDACVYFFARIPDPILRTRESLRVYPKR